MSEPLPVRRYSLPAMAGNLAEFWCPRCDQLVLTIDARLGVTGDIVTVPMVAWADGHAPIQGEVIACPHCGFGFGEPAA